MYLDVLVHLCKGNESLESVPNQIATVPRLQLALIVVAHRILLALAVLKESGAQSSVVAPSPAAHDHNEREARDGRHNVPMRQFQHAFLVPFLLIQTLYLASGNLSQHRQRRRQDSPHTRG